MFVVDVRGRCSWSMFVVDVRGRCSWSMFVVDVRFNGLKPKIPQDHTRTIHPNPNPADPEPKKKVKLKMISIDCKGKMDRKISPSQKSRWTKT